MIQYHIGFGVEDLGPTPPRLAILSGDPDRARRVATDHLRDHRVLSENRGLHSYLAHLPGSGRAVLSCTSGMGAPSASIVMNELAQVGVRTIIRVGTCGSIQPHVAVGDVVISSASLCRQGAAADIAPVEFPAAADPFVTVALNAAAVSLGFGDRAHVGVTASVDTFFEGQERVESSANPHLMRSMQGMTDEFAKLGVLNYEMEAGTLFKMGLVYGVEVGCVCAVIAQRVSSLDHAASEHVDQERKREAERRAIEVAVSAAESLVARS